MLTDAGLTIPTLEELIEDAIERIPNEVRANLVTDDDSLLLKIYTPMLLALEELYELTQAVYNSQDIRKATGASLDNIVRFLNITRKPATNSTQIIPVTGDNAGIEVPAGTIIRRALTEDLFQVLESVTIPVGLSSAVTVEALETGPIDAPAGESYDFVNNIIGITLGSPTSTPVLGSSRESDSELRNRALGSNQGLGTNTVGALYSALLALDKVQEVIIVNNVSGAADTSTTVPTPEKSIQPIIFPDLSADSEALAEIGNVILNNKAAGIGSYGSTVVFADTTAGITEEVGFSFVSDTEHSVSASVSVISGSFPANGLSLIQEEIEKYFGNTAYTTAQLDAGLAALGVGEDIIVQDLECRVRDAIAGIINIDISVTNAVTSANSTTLLSVPSDERAVVNTLTPAITVSLV